MVSKKQKHNLILITLDGARHDRIKDMKNFRTLMGKGTFFSEMITYAPYTIASMPAIFSGTYGNRNGVDNYYGAYSFKRDLFETLTGYLKKNGYYTMGDILNPLVVPKENFDELKVHDEYKDDLTLRHSKLLDKASKINKKGKPFFLFLHYSNIHTSIKINVSRKYSHFSKEYFSNKDKNLEAYDSYLKKADDYLGKILNKIGLLGLNDSIIIVNSDHGISIGEKLGERSYGVFCYDYTLKVFSLFYQPDFFPKKHISQLVRTIDVLPTILDILNITESKKYERIDGKSLMPLIKGRQDKRIAFAESGNPNFSDPPKPPKKPNCRAIRTSKWKFIHNYWNDSEELYDLENDQEENTNLINKNKKIANELREKLNNELRKGFALKLKSIKKKSSK